MTYLRSGPEAAVGPNFRPVYWVTSYSRAVGFQLIVSNYNNYTSVQKYNPTQQAKQTVVLDAHDLMFLSMTNATLGALAHWALQLCPGKKNAPSQATTSTTRRVLFAHVLFQNTPAVLFDNHKDNAVSAAVRAPPVRAPRKHLPYLAEVPLIW